MSPHRPEQLPDSGSEADRALLARNNLMVLRVIPVGEPEQARAAGFEMSRRNLFYVIFRHPVRIVACLAAFSIAAAIFVSAQPNLFTSEALIRTRGLRNTVMIDPAATDGGSLLKSGYADAGMLSAEMDLINSDGILLKVVDGLGPEKILGDEAVKPRKERSMLGRARARVYEFLDFDTTPMQPRQMALMDLKDHLEMWESGANRELLHVSFKSGDPARSQLVLNTILDEYQNYHLASNRTRFSPEFFKGRAEETKKQIDQTAAELDRRRRELSIIMPDTEKQLLLTQKSNIESGIVEAQGQSSAAHETIRVLQGFTKRYEDKTGQKMPRATNPVAMDMQRKLVDLETEEARLANKYADNYPQLVDLRAQIRSLKTALNAARQDNQVDAMAMALGMSDPVFNLTLRIETAQADTAAASSKIKLFNQQNASINQRLANLMTHETGLKELERKLETLNLQYRQYQSSQHAAEIAQTLDKDSISNVSVDQAATLPFLSTKSQRKMLSLLALGVFMGLASGLGWAFLLEYGNDTLRTRGDVENFLDLPVLIALPATRHHLPLIEGS
ncbi:hypothetical protein LLG95_00600 [bacterium]|nr:hypothetical protein [bacterium]